MAVIYTVIYHTKVVREDIPRISQKDRVRIAHLIEQKIMTDPQFFGKPLRQSLKGYRSLRIDPYRIMFRIEKHTVKILAIQHRSVVYKGVEKRMNQHIRR